MTSTANHGESRDYFEDLRQRARAAGLRGDFDEVLELCDAALTWARRHGDESDADLVGCYRSAVMIHRGHGEEAIRDLQRILMKSRDPVCRHLAAYNISIFYEFREDFEKSRRYVRLALEQAEQTGSDPFLAACFNQNGNLLIRNSKFENAIAEYETAYRLFTDEQIFERLTLLLNMGYCHLATGHLAEGFGQLFTVRRTFIRLHVDQGPVLGRLRLCFCFGYLEIGRHTPAKLHGEAGLKIAEACGERDLIKKALYLLGEAEKLAGDEIAAYSHFARLQEEFYPDNVYLPELLVNHETKQLVNLWA